MEITKDMYVGEVLDLDPALGQYFLEIGMHCLGCPSARGETIEEACEVHGQDVEKLVEKLNEAYNG